MENINWPISNKDLARLLGIKRGTLGRHIQYHSPDLIEGKHYTKGDIRVPNAPTLMYAWTKDGAIQIASYCKRSSKAREFLEQQGVPPLHTNYIEGELTEFIAECLIGIYVCKNQHYINRFVRVDLFIEELGLVIECDELGHNYNDRLQEKYREKAIDELKYSIIRLNPNLKPFKFSSAINEILLFARNLPNKTPS
jgi:very-short-patch-repair endonuclease